MFNYSRFLKMASFYFTPTSFSINLNKSINRKRCYIDFALRRIRCTKKKKRYIPNYTLNFFPVTSYSNQTIDNRIESTIVF